MIMRLKLTLGRDEYSALLKVSTDELRHPADQARFILRQYLIQRGLMQESEHPVQLEGE